MQINFIFALVITLSVNFGALGQKIQTKDETSGISTSQNNATATANEETSNSTVPIKNSKLTGIPQVDYIYDPNLPRELRGYNLSSYPFFSSVPPDEDIHFKCDGLHDGFYASIEHKCQIYHHCVYGIRHDFLCANFTAFDQKTFICHFVSDVDCEGSKKYWNRNDDLYMPTTTTSTTTTTTEPPPTVYRRPMRPKHPLRRPFKRRPVNDYYYDEEYEDEFYEEPVNRRPILNRSRPRKPIVEYDYEEDLLPRRPLGNRNRYREKNEDYGDDNAEPQTQVKQYTSSSGQKGNKNTAYAVDRPIFRKDKHHEADNTDGPQATTDIVRRISVRRRVNEKRTSQGVSNQQSEETLKEGKSRNSPSQPEEYPTPKTPTPKIYGLPRTPPRIGRPVPINEKKKYQYPVEGATTTSAPVQEEYADDLEEYYDNNSDYDYGNERKTAPKTISHRHLKDTFHNLEDYDTPIVNQRKRFRNETPLKGERLRYNRKKLNTPVHTDYEDENAETIENVRRPIVRPNSNRSHSKNPSPVKLEEDFPPNVPLKRKKNLHIPIKNEAINEEAVLNDDEHEEEPAERQHISGHNLRNPDRKLPAMTDETLPREKYIAPVRLMKRPFLPSRGGSPYLPRRLQLVGVGNQKKESNSIRHLSNQNSRSKVIAQQDKGNQEIEEVAYYSNDQLSDDKSETRKGTGTDKSQNYFENIEKYELQTSQSENAQHELDLFYEHDYDVTINDALNPTLTPLSSQSLSHHLHRN